MIYCIIFKLFITSYEKPKLENLSDYSFQKLREKGKADIFYWVNINGDEFNKMKNFFSEEEKVEYYYHEIYMLNEERFAEFLLNFT